MDITGRTETAPDGRKIYEAQRTNTWTDRMPADLEQEGYRRCEGLYDSIIWWGVPVFLRFHGLTEFDSRQKNGDGEYIIPQDTPATLHDFLKSNADREFLKGMAKTSMPDMDLHKLIMIMILVAGAVAGLFLLGVI